MPIYELQCQKCHNVEDVELRMSDPIPPCPCGGERVKILQAPAIRVACHTGPIVSERQIWDSHGKNWRDRETKNPTAEGGGRKRIYVGA